MFRSTIPWLAQQYDLLHNKYKLFSEILVTLVNKEHIYLKISTEDINTLKIKPPIKCV